MAVACLVSSAGVAGAEPRPARAGAHGEVVFEHVDTALLTPTVNTHVIYLNDCHAGGGCLVHGGQTDSRTDSSSVSHVGQGELSPFSQDQTTWDAVVACMQQVYAPFNVTITTTDPGTAPHFEIMFGGDPNALGLGSNVGGISPFDPSCPDYIPNSLVFVFDVWGSNVNEICATAAQEVAHSFMLDHVTDPSDPMTYVPYGQRRLYQDRQDQCGSDCVNGHSPFGDTCSGPSIAGVASGPQNHVCFCGGNTQNSVQVIKALFGASVASPPIVKITGPLNGAAVQPGFPVLATVTDDQGVTMAKLTVDGIASGTSTSLPYAFNAPASLAPGQHTVVVTAYDTLGTPGSAMIDVIIGDPCHTPGDCPVNTDTCVGGRCVPGSGVVGGLGSPCTDGSTCASGICASDQTGAKYCAEECALNGSDCPSGFGCVDSGGTTGGICWPGADNGGGGGCSTSANGTIGLGLGFALLLVTRRRPRS